MAGRSTAPAAPDAPAPPARRGRRISEERSEDILEAVLELLHEEGYDQLRMQDVADRAGVGLSTIYRRWPTKQELVRACLECPAAQEVYATSGDPRADMVAFLTRMADDLNGDGAQTMLGFLATIRSDPEVAESFRELSIARKHEHLKALLAAELGEDHPELDLLASAGPAILLYRAAVCGQPMDPPVVAAELTDLLFSLGSTTR